MTGIRVRSAGTRDNLFELAPVALLVTDFETRIHDANRRAMDLLGARSSLRGDLFTSYVAEWERQTIADTVARQRTDPGPMELPVRMHCARQQLVEMMCACSAVRIAGENLLQWALYEDPRGRVGEEL